MKSLMISLMLIIVFSCAATAGIYKIGTLPWAGFSPVNVAHEKGFWKNYGQDVRVILYTCNSEMKKALENKRIDFALDVPGAWVKSYMEGIPVTILGEIEWSCGGDKIILKKETDIRKLKSRPIGVFSDSVILMLHRYMTEQNLQISDFKIIELDPESLAKNFISGRLQMIVCYDPQALRAEQEGNGEVAATSASYPGSITDSIAARPDLLKDAPRADAVAILKGWIDAVKWIEDETNWNEYKTILNTKTFAGDPPYADGELKQLLEGVRILDIKMLRDQNKDGGGLSAYLKELRSVMKLNGLLKKDFSPEDIFDNSIMMEALEGQE
jgi:NitT/TauT family transport system substrate-binding protein